MKTDKRLNPRRGPGSADMLRFMHPLPSDFYDFLSCLQAHSLIVGMVLHTDMAVHHDLLKTFTNDVTKAQPSPKLWDPKIVSLILQMLLHLADLSNPGRPFALALKWAERIIIEFMHQVWGVKGERVRGMQGGP